MNHLCEDVLAIVLSYVELSGLVPFFILHNLDFRMVFKYRAYWIMNDELPSIFNGVILKRIICYNNLGLNYVSARCLDSVNIVKSRYDYVKEMVEKCVNIKSLTFTMINMRGDFDFLSENRRIVKMTFDNCDWGVDCCNFLTKCVNLRKLKFSCSLTSYDMMVISRIKKLRVLKVWMLSYAKGAKLNCVNLRKIRMHCGPGMNLNVLLGCKNLHEIEIVGVGGCNSADIDFSWFKKLRKVVFKKSNIISGLMGLNKCVNLRCVKFIGCSNIVMCVNELRYRGVLVFCYDC